MKLSILICTIPSRAANFLPRILQQLEPQVAHPEVELLYLGDNKRRPVGHKRNDLLRAAQGDYVCFIDDDDAVAPSYVASLLPHLDGVNDVVCFQVDLTWNGRRVHRTYFSKDYPCDRNLPDRYERLPNHVLPVRRELALKVGYQPVSLREDSDYAARLRPLLRTEKQIDAVLYYYTFNVETTETQQHLNPKRGG